jgi:hypothetical protein
MADKNKLYDHKASKAARGEKQAYLGADKEPAERQNKEKPADEKAGEKKAVQEAKATGKTKEPEAATDSEVQDKARKDLKDKGVPQEEIDKIDGGPEPDKRGEEDLPATRHAKERDSIHQRHRTERRDAHGNYRSELDKMASRHAKELDEAYSRHAEELKVGAGGVTEEVAPPPNTEIAEA